jgi:hypothetical protein
VSADVATLSEFLVANRTLVGSVSRMHAEVVAEVAALCKSARAVIDTTLEVKLLAGAEGIVCL